MKPTTKTQVGTANNWAIREDDINETTVSAMRRHGNPAIRAASTYLRAQLDLWARNDYNHHRVAQALDNANYLLPLNWRTLLGSTA